MSRLPPIFAEGRGRGIAGVALLALGQAACTGVAAFATRDVFVALRGEGAGVPLTALLLIALAGLAIAALRVAERIVAERIGQHYAAALRVKLFTHLSRMSARAVAQRRNGALAMRFVGDLTAVRNWISVGIARLLSASIVLPASAAVLFVLNPSLAIAGVVPVAIGLVLMALAGPRLGPAHRRLRARRARLAADMSERVPHAPELRLLGRTRTEINHLLRHTDRLVTSAMQRARGAALMRAVPDAVSGVAAACVCLTALRAGSAGAEAAGALAALGLMVQPMRDLAGAWDRNRAWTAARCKCEAMLAMPVVPRSRSRNTPAVPGHPQSLRFVGVSSGTLRDVTVEAAAGRKVAIVGANGAGKSTLLSLAAGLETADSGKVLFGHHTPTSLRAPERRSTIALASPRSPILAGSLRRALTMGASPRPDDAAILEQVRAFGLQAVLIRVGGLEGRISEGGRNLSAGEARRVLLARAALSTPRLLLLDEPDDALDADGPGLVEHLVSCSDATTLVVTHNLAVARCMDELWCLVDGRIVEAGPPARLLSGDSATARLFAPRGVAIDAAQACCRSHLVGGAQ